MPYLRQRRRIASNGRVRVRLTPEQRNLLLPSPHIPRDLGHLLHSAPVRKGKLELRLDRESVDAMIMAVAALPATGRDTRQSLDTFLRYLDGLADRFADEEADSEVQN